MELEQDRRHQPIFFFLSMKRLANLENASVFPSRISIGVAYRFGK